MSLHYSDSEFEKLLNLFENDDSSLKEYFISEINKSNEKIDYDEVFESHIDGGRWISLLHVLPQDLVQGIRLLKNDGEIMDLKKLDKYDFGQYFTGDLLIQLLERKSKAQVGKKVKARKVVHPILIHTLFGFSRDKIEINADTSYAEYSSLLDRIRMATDDRYPIITKVARMDLYRLMIDPYRLSMNMRTKLLESVITGLKSLLDRISSLEIINDAMKSKRNSNNRLKFESATSRQQNLLNQRKAVRDYIPLITSYIFSLHASLPYNDREWDSDSISDEGAWVANIGVKALPIISMLLENRAIADIINNTTDNQEITVLKYAVASFITRLSWNNDNKAMIYQTANGIILRIILRWLDNSDGRDIHASNSYGSSADIDDRRLSGSISVEQTESKESFIGITPRAAAAETTTNTGETAKIGENYFAISQQMESYFKWKGRVHCATTVQNISKAASNLSRLIKDAEFFTRVVRLAMCLPQQSTQDLEHNKVLRRIMSCIQSIASSRQFIATVVELYRELSGSTFAPTTPLGDWARRLSRNSSLTKENGKAINAFSLRRHPVPAAPSEKPDDSSATPAYLRSKSLEARSPKEGTPRASANSQRSHDDMPGKDDSRRDSLETIASAKVSDFLMGLLQHIGPGKNAFVELQVFGALADFVYSEVVRPLRPTTSLSSQSPSILQDLKSVLNLGTVKNFIVTSGLLETPGYLHQGVQYEVARLTWSVLRNPDLFGLAPADAAVDEEFLEMLVKNLDVFAASVGVFYEDVPRRNQRPDEIADLLHVVSAGCLPPSLDQKDRQPPANETFRKSSTNPSDSAPLTDIVEGLSLAAAPSFTPVVKLFAAWAIAHFSQNSEDRTLISSLNGVAVVTSACRSICEALCSDDWIRESVLLRPVAKKKRLVLFLVLKLLLFALSRLTSHGDRIGLGTNTFLILQDLSAIYNRLSSLAGIDDQITASTIKPYQSSPSNLAAAASTTATTAPVLTITTNTNTTTNNNPLATISEVSSLDSIGRSRTFSSTENCAGSISTAVHDSSSTLMHSRLYAISPKTFKWLPVIDPDNSQLKPPTLLTYAANVNPTEDGIVEVTVLAMDSFLKIKVVDSDLILRKPTGGSTTGGHGRVSLSSAPDKVEDIGQQYELREGLDPVQIDAEKCLASILENAVRHQAVVHYMKQSGTLGVFVDLTASHCISPSVFFSTLLRLPTLVLLRHSSADRLEKIIWDFLNSEIKRYEPSRVRKTPNIIRMKKSTLDGTYTVSVTTPPTATKAKPRTPRRSDSRRGALFPDRSISHESNDSLESPSMDMFDQLNSPGEWLQLSPLEVDVDDLDAKSLALKLLCRLIVSIPEGEYRSTSRARPPPRQRQDSVATSEQYLSKGTAASVAESDITKSTQFLPPDSNPLHRVSSFLQAASNPIDPLAAVDDDNTIKLSLISCTTPLLMLDHIYHQLDRSKSVLLYHNLETAQVATVVLRWQVNVLEVFSATCDAFRRTACLDAEERYHELQYQNYATSATLGFLTRKHMEGFAKMTRYCFEMLEAAQLPDVVVPPRKVAILTKLYEKRRMTAVRVLGAVNDLVLSIIEENSNSPVRNSSASRDSPTTEEDMYSNLSLRTVSGGNSEKTDEIEIIQPVISQLFERWKALDFCCQLLEKPAEVSLHLLSLVLRLVAHERYLSTNAKNSLIRRAALNFSACMDRIFKIALDTISTLLPVCREQAKQSSQADDSISILIYMLKILCEIASPKMLQRQAPSSAQALSLVACLAYPLEPGVVSEYMKQLTQERRSAHEGREFAPGSRKYPRPQTSGHSSVDTPHQRMRNTNGDPPGRFFSNSPRTVLRNRVREEYSSSPHPPPPPLQDSPHLQDNHSDDASPLAAAMATTKGTATKLGAGVMDLYKTPQAAVVRYLAVKLTLVMSEDVAMSRIIVFPQSAEGKSKANSSSINSNSNNDLTPKSADGKGDEENDDVTPTSQKSIATLESVPEDVTEVDDENTDSKSQGSSSTITSTRGITGDSFRQRKMTLRIDIFPDPEDEWTESNKPDFRGAEWAEEASIDVKLRSWKGCIPLLWAMVRFGSLEGQCAAIDVLNKLSQNNILVKEAIFCMDDIKALVKAGRREDRAGLQKGLSQMLLELSKYPKLRKQLRRDGGLLLILQLNRSKDKEVQAFAAKAMKNFGSNNMEIYLQLLSSSARYIGKIIQRDGSLKKRSVGPMLLQPIHHIQLKEALRGLVDCSMNEYYVEQMVTTYFGYLHDILVNHPSSSSQSKENAPDELVMAATDTNFQALDQSLIDLLLLVFYVRDGDVQRDTLRILRGLFQNGGELFRQALKEEQSIMLAENVLYLLQPVEIRASSIIIAAARRMKGVSATSAGEGGLFVASLQRFIDRQTPYIGTTATASGMEHDQLPSRRVALVVDSELLSTTRLAAEVIQLWATQDVSMAHFFLRHGALNIIGSRLSGPSLWDLAKVPHLKHFYHASSDHLPADSTEEDHHHNNKMESVTQVQILLIRVAVLIEVSVGGLMAERSVKCAQLTRCLLFFQSYHFDRRVRNEALQAILLSNGKLSAPSSGQWEQGDVLLWLLCIGLPDLIPAMEKFYAAENLMLQSVRKSTIKKVTPSWKMFMAIKKLLREGGWEGVGDIWKNPMGITFDKLVTLSEDRLMADPFNANRIQAIILLSALRDLQLKEVAIRRGYIENSPALSVVSSSANGDGLYSERGDYTATSFPVQHNASSAVEPGREDDNSQSAVTLRSIFYLSMKQQQELVGLCMSLLRVLGYVPIAEDCWSKWWGMYYLNGWCFEVADSSKHTFTLRLIRFGATPPDLNLKKSKSSRRYRRAQSSPQHWECRQRLKLRGLDLQIYSGSLVHCLLLDAVSDVLRANSLEKEFLVDIQCPPSNLRFWRVEAIALRHSRRTVYLECSSSKVLREQLDPPNHACSVLEVVEDPLGHNHLFVLDVVDMTNEKDKNGRTSLIRAVMKHNKELCEKLLSDPNVDCRIIDNQGCSALLYAVILKHDDLFEMLLTYVTRHLRDLSGSSSSGNSSSSVKFEIGSYKQLIDHKDSNGRAALHHVVNDEEERLRLTTLLLQAKAEVNIRDSDGNTPLHYASLHGHVDVVDTLIKYNANTTAPNKRKQTPLHFAAEKLHVRIVTILLQENPEMAVRAEDIDSCTALHYAIKSTSQDSFRLMDWMYSSQRHQATYGGGGGGALSYPFSAGGGGRGGTGTGHGDKDGSVYVREGEEEVVQILLRYGADLYDLDKDGRTPVDFKLYYHQHYQEISKAVYSYLECKVAKRNLFWSNISKYVCSPITWKAVPLLDKKENEKRFRRLQNKDISARKLFSSPRMQEAIKEEWRFGGCWRRALFAWMFFALYVTVFTVAAVFTSGQNTNTGYYLSQSVQSILFQQALRHDDQPNPRYMDMQDVNDFWLWTSNCLVTALENGTSVSWYTGDQINTGPSNEVYTNNLDRVITRVRFSQWRTNTKSCKVPNIVNDVVTHCFPDYCPKWSWDAQTWLTCVPNEDTTSFGPENKYKYYENVHKYSFQGQISVYGMDSFTTVLPKAAETGEEFTDSLESGIAELRADQWIDSGTRAVAVEFTLYSPAVNKFTYVQSLVEFPAQGNYPLPQFFTFTFNGYSALWYPSKILQVEDQVGFVTTLLLAVFILLHISSKFTEWSKFRSYFFLNGYNYLDLLLIVLQVVRLLIQLVFEITFGEKSADFFGNNHLLDGFYLDLRQVVLLRMYERLVTSLALILAWCKFLEPSQLLVKEFYLLVRVILLMIKNLAKSYAPLMLIIFFAWLFARYTLLSQDQQGFQTISWALATQYPESLGQVFFGNAAGDNLFPGWQLFLMVVFMIIYFIIMLNLFISILNDLYLQLKEEAKNDWCKLQAIQIYMFDQSSATVSYSNTCDRPPQYGASECMLFLWKYFFNGLTRSVNAVTYVVKYALCCCCCWWCCLTTSTNSISNIDVRVDPSAAAPHPPPVTPMNADDDGNSSKSNLNNSSTMSDLVQDQPPLDRGAGAAEVALDIRMSIAGIKSNRRLKKIREQVTDMKRLFFQSDSKSGYAGIQTILEEINDWNTEVHTTTPPPLQLVEFLLHEIIRIETLHHHKGMRELLQLDALVVITAMMEKITTKNPTLLRDSLDDVWTHTLRFGLRSVYHLTQSIHLPHPHPHHRGGGGGGGMSTEPNLNHSNTLLSDDLAKGGLGLSLGHFDPLGTANVAQARKRRTLSIDTNYPINKPNLLRSDSLDVTGVNYRKFANRGSATGPQAKARQSQSSAAPFVTPELTEEQMQWIHEFLDRLGGRELLQTLKKQLKTLSTAVAPRNLRSSITHTMSRITTTTMDPLPHNPSGDPTSKYTTVSSSGANNRTTRSRLRLQSIEYQRDLLVVLSCVLRLEILTERSDRAVNRDSNTNNSNNNNNNNTATAAIAMLSIDVPSSSSRQLLTQTQRGGGGGGGDVTPLPSLNDNVLANVLLEFAANDEMDDLHEDLAITSANLIKHFCLPELFSNLCNCFDANGTIDIYQLLRIITICRRVASLGSLGVKSLCQVLPDSGSAGGPIAALRNQLTVSSQRSIALVLVSVLTALTSLPTRDRIHRITAHRIAELILMIIKRCVVRIAVNSNNNGSTIAEEYDSFDTQNDLIQLPEDLVKEIVLLLMRALTWEVKIELSRLTGAVKSRDHGDLGTGGMRLLQDVDDDSSYEEEDSSSAIIETLSYLLYLGHEDSVNATETATLGTPERGAKAGQNAVKKMMQDSPDYSTFLDICNGSFGRGLVPASATSTTTNPIRHVRQDLIQRLPEEKADDGDRSPSDILQNMPSYGTNDSTQLGGNQIGDMTFFEENTSLRSQAKLNTLQKKVSFTFKEEEDFEIFRNDSLLEFGNVSSADDFDDIIATGGKGSGGHKKSASNDGNNLNLNLANRRK